MLNKTHNKLFILGAEFSEPAGFPLTKNLFLNMCRIAENNSASLNTLYYEYLDYFNTAIKEYEQFSNTNIQYDNLEFFLDYFDHQQYLNLSGLSDNNQKYGEIQIICKLLISEILLDKQKKIENENLYSKFVDKLNSSDLILTLNYDTLLEKIFIKLNKYFQYVPNNFSEVKLNVSGKENEDAVPIIKLHGSINWFDFNDYINHIFTIRESEHFNGITSDFIFNNHMHRANLQSIIPFRFKRSKSPLNDIYYISDLDLEAYIISIKRESMLSPMHTHTFPVILTPSRSKLLYAQSIKDLFKNTYKSIEPDKIIIIGCSLNEYDFYIRQIIYWASYLRINSNKEIIVINKAKNKKEKKHLDDSYSYLNSKPFNLKFFYDGLNDETLEYIFK